MTNVDEEPRGPWLLVRFRKVWADEFTAEGLALLTPDEWRRLQRLYGRFEWGFGTNETFYESEQSLGRDLTVLRELDDEAATALAGLLGVEGADPTFGQFPDWVFLDDETLLGWYGLDEDDLQEWLYPAVET